MANDGRAKINHESTESTAATSREPISLDGLLDAGRALVKAYRDPDVGWNELDAWADNFEQALDSFTEVCKCGHPMSEHDAAIGEALDYIETNPDDHASRLLAALVSELDVSASSGPRPLPEPTKTGRIVEERG